MGRAGRFGTKGLALTFVATDEDQEAWRNNPRIQKAEKVTYSHFIQFYSISIRILLSILFLLEFYTYIYTPTQKLEVLPHTK